MKEGCVKEEGMKFNKKKKSEKDGDAKKKK